MSHPRSTDPRARNLSARIQQRLPPYTPANLPTAPRAASSSSPFVSAVPSSPPTPRPGTIRTRILIISDTHNQPLYAQNDVEHAFKTPLPAADVLLHAGDLSNTGRIEQMHTTFELLAGAAAPLKLVIAGNHDLTLDPNDTVHIRAHYRTPAMRAEVAEERKLIREMWTGEQAKAAGIVYLEEGTYSFTLQNGASFTLYASPYSPEFYNWAFMYPHEEDRWNPVPERGVMRSMLTKNGKQQAQQPANPIPTFPNVDIVMTHGPPFQILDRVGAHHHVGCPHLLRALARVRPRLHVFGHIHEDWGAVRVDWQHGTGQYLDVGTGEDEDVIGRGHVKLDVTGGKGASKETPTTPTTTKGAVDEAAEAESDSSEKKSKKELKWGRETLCVNAAIMSKRFRPTNAPWLIDLLLPAAAEEKL